MEPQALRRVFEKRRRAKQVLIKDYFLKLNEDSMSHFNT